jgi:hypothetical protein
VYSAGSVMAGPLLGDLDAGWQPGGGGWHLPGVDGAQT